jgi:hypothetical protein
VGATMMTRKQPRCTFLYLKQEVRMKMKKIYIFETQPDQIVVEKADNFHIAIRIGGRVAMLDYDDWYDLCYLRDSLYIDKKETSDNDLDIRTEYSNDKTGQDIQVSCAQMDWKDSRLEYKDKGVVI